MAWRCGIGAMVEVAMQMEAGRNALLISGLEAMTMVVWSEGEMMEEISMPPTCGSKGQ